MTTVKQNKPIAMITMKRFFIYLMCALIAGVTLYCVKQEAQDSESLEASNEVIEQLKNPGERKVITEPVVEPYKTRIMTARVMKVYHGGGKQTRWFKGKSHYYIDGGLSFKVPGSVSEINVRVGQRLSYERVVARLDSSKYKRVVDKLEVAFERSKVETLQAAANLRNVSASFKTGAATEKELDAAISTYDNAQRMERYAGRQLQTGRLNLGRHELRLWMRATVSKVNVRVNDRIKAGQPVIHVSSKSPILVTVYVPAILANQVGIDGRCKARFSGGKAYRAKVTRVEPMGSGPDAMAAVTVRLRHYYSALRSGMPAEVSFRFDYRTSANRLILSPESIWSDSGGNYVYVIKPMEGDGEGYYGTVERRHVGIGKLDIKGREINSGLRNGEYVVVSGINRLKNGMKVKWK